MKIKLFAVALLAVGSAATVTVMAHAQPAPPVQGAMDGWMPMEPDFAEDDMFNHGARFGDRVGFLREHYNPVLVKYALSATLSAQETLVGITAEQQAAWRAYTNAVLAMVPDKATVSGLLGAAEAQGEPLQAFGRVELLADGLIAQHDRAAALKQAITNLRKVLTPEQLEAARIPRRQFGANL